MFSRQITAQTAGLEDMRRAYKIAKRQAENYKTIRWWPTLGQFINHKRQKGLKLRSHRFLSYLNTWFYSELSQDVHLSGAGIARMFSKLLIQPTDTDRELVFRKIKSNNFMLALTFAVAIATELNDIGKFNRGSKLEYIWKILDETWPDSRRLYRMRYRALVARHKSYS